MQQMYFFCVIKLDFFCVQAGLQRAQELTHSLSEWIRLSIIPGQIEKSLGMEVECQKTIPVQCFVTSICLLFNVVSFSQ